MFLPNLNDLNAKVVAQLEAARMKTTLLPFGSHHLTAMDFLKVDHSPISVQVPTHKINIVANDQTLQLESDFVNAIIRFVFDTANEFERPNIHITPVYGNSFTRLRAKTLSFNIAMWEYDETEVRWLEATNLDPDRKGQNINTAAFKVEVQKHELLKTVPFEINVWTQNIVRDINNITAAESCGLQYMVKLEQELLAGARNASLVLHKMQRAASVQDVIASMFRAGKYENAATVLGEALKTQVTVFTMGKEPALMIDDRLYRLNQVFALVAGLRVDGVEANPPSDFWTYREANEEDLAKANALGLNIDYNRVHNGRH